MCEDENPVIGRVKSNAPKDNYNIYNGNDAFRLSSEFFSNGIRNYLFNNDINTINKLDNIHKDIIDKIKGISLIFKDIVTFPYLKNKEGKGVEELKIESLGKSSVLTILKDDSNLGTLILSLIDEGINDIERILLEIISPIGSYKNRLLQYVYLYIAINYRSNVLPFYIDVSKLEEFTEEDKHNFINYFSSGGEIEKMINSGQTKTPLLILDNVRYFQCGQNNAYKSINSFLERNVNVKIIIGGDSIFTFNYNRLKPNPFLNNDYKKKYNRIKITSLNMTREKECIEFINNCINFFKGEHSKIYKYKGIDVWNKLSGAKRSEGYDLEFYSLDAYNLIQILNKLDEKYKINQSICMEDLYALEEITPEIAKMAYLFEYTKDNHRVDYSGDCWEIIKKHRTYLDFLIAKHYCFCLQEAIEKQDIEKMPKVVLPKNITRFLIQIIVNEICEDGDRLYAKVIKFVENNFSKFDLKVKSQLAFILGRVPDDVKDLARNVLKKIKSDKSIEIESKCSREECARRMFVQRSISISLIYLGDVDELKSYVNLLFDEIMADEINRGFHLDYYGDISTFWNNGAWGVSLEDDLSKGKNTFRKLGININNLIKRYQKGETSLKDKCILIMQVVTYYKLLVARKHCFRNDALSNNLWEYCNAIAPLIEKDCDFSNDEISRILLYVGEMLDRTKFFNKCCLALNNGRNGWIKRGIINYESIAAHMYNCWLMGIMYLPYESIDEENYNRQTILELLLIHDIGECKIGDKIRGTKSQLDMKEENKTIVDFVATYMNKDNGLSELWQDSESENPKNINARIAKEIDYIQGVYQYCLYCTEGNVKFTNDDWNSWCNDINYVKTSIGKDIIWNAILNNLIFVNSSNKELAKSIKKIGDNWNSPKNVVSRNKA